MRRSSHSPLPTEDTLGELSESPFKRHVDSARKMKAKRSQSCPNESLFDVRPIISHSEVHIVSVSAALTPQLHHHTGT